MTVDFYLHKDTKILEVNLESVIYVGSFIKSYCFMQRPLKFIEGISRHLSGSRIRSVH